MTVPLFTPITFRGLTIRNRIGVSPMCQYSAEDGFASDWHLVHIGSRALGGAGLIIMEATGVQPEGRITPACTGIWKDEHIAPLQRVTEFAKHHGAAIGIQLAHAGRKASMASPFKGGQRITAAEGGWQTVAPSAIPFQPDFAPPHALTKDEIKQLVDDFVAAAKRAVRAGFQIIEIHGAHGYLLHEFYSPLSNKREDEYGGTEENRFRLILDIARAIRAAVPQEIVLGARLSCSDWAEGGFTIDDSVRLSAALKKGGVDFIDCSSGALTPDAKIPVGPNYQVPFAKAIRDKAAIPTAAVGMINEPQQANDIILKGEADMVFLARAMLRDPYWALHAADVLGAEMDVPQQYLRGYRSEQLARPRQKKAG
jgi:2,4-dienoyl-CoA reductase-like NADH-dependent reductase (Old Yellow Enzyme family)